MGDFNKLEGIVELILPSGILYLSRRLTNRLKAKFEDWLEATARKRVFELSKDLTQQQMQQSMQAIVTASAAGSLSWGGEAMITSLQQLPGLVKMIYLLAEASGKMPMITEEKVLEIMLDPTPIGQPPDEPTVVEEGKEPEPPPVYTSAQLIGEILGEIVRSDANFLLPPMRGKAGLN